MNIMRLKGCKKVGSKNNGENINSGSEYDKIDSGAKENKKPGHKEDIEKTIEGILGDDSNPSCSFLINASNQMSLSKVSNLSNIQANAVFILIHPYYIDNFNMEDMDIVIKMDGEGAIYIDNKAFEAIELKPGIKIFGVARKI